VLAGMNVEALFRAVSSKGAKAFSHFWIWSRILGPDLCTAASEKTCASTLARAGPSTEVYIGAIVSCTAIVAIWTEFLKLAYLIFLKILKHNVVAASQEVPCFFDAGKPFGNLAVLEIEFGTKLADLTDF